MSPKTPSRKSRLSVAQWELVGQFNDGAFEYPDLSFEQVAEKLLGAPFTNTPTDREFEREAKKIFRSKGEQTFTGKPSASSDSFRSRE